MAVPCDCFKTSVIWFSMTGKYQVMKDEVIPLMAVEIVSVDTAVWKHRKVLSTVSIFWHLQLVVITIEFKFLKLLGDKLADTNLFKLAYTNFFQLFCCIQSIMNLFHQKISYRYALITLNDSRMYKLCSLYINRKLTQFGIN